MIGATAGAGAQLNLFKVASGRLVSGSGKSTVTSYGYYKSAYGGLNRPTRVFGSTGKEHEVYAIRSQNSQIHIQIVNASDGTVIPNTDATFKRILIHFIDSSGTSFVFTLPRSSASLSYSTVNTSQVGNAKQFGHPLTQTGFSTAYNNSTPLYVEFRSD